MNSAAPPGPRWRAWAELLRPPNIVTAWADIGAGVAASGLLALQPDFAGERLGWLLLATTGLYGGGIVLNDVFDYEIDARERPERPLPSGRVGRLPAAVAGFGLLGLGVAAAAQVNLLSLALALGVASCAVVYDVWGKHQPVVGPINMGLCRGGNLLLGVSAVPAAFAAWWGLGLIPVAYIAAVTAISRGEVGGGARGVGWLAVGLLAGVVGSLVGLELLPGYAVGTASPFVLGLALWVGTAFVRAARRPDAAIVRRAVRTGVLALILLDAALAAGFGGWLPGLAVLLLLPLSLGLARLFAVT